MSPADRHLAAWGWDAGFDATFAPHRQAGLVRVSRVIPEGGR